MQALRITAGARRPAFLSPVLWANLLATEEPRAMGGSDSSPPKIPSSGESVHRHSAPPQRQETRIAKAGHARRCSVASSIAVRREPFDASPPFRIRSNTLPSGSRPEIVDVIARGNFTPPPKNEDEQDGLGIVRARLHSSCSLEGRPQAKGKGVRSRGGSVEPSALVQRVQSPLRSATRLSDEPGDGQAVEGAMKEGQEVIVPRLSDILSLSGNLSQGTGSSTGGSQSVSLQGTASRELGVVSTSRRMDQPVLPPSQQPRAMALAAPGPAFDVGPALQEARRLRQLMTEEFQSYSESRRPVLSPIQPLPTKERYLSSPPPQENRERVSIEVLLPQILRRMDILEAEMVRLNRQVTEMKRNANSSLESEEPSEVAQEPPHASQPARATMMRPPPPQVNEEESQRPPRPEVAPPPHLVRRATATSVRSPRAFLTMPLDDELAGTTLGELRRRLGVVTESIAVGDGAEQSTQAQLPASVEQDIDISQSSSLVPTMRRPTSSPTTTTTTTTTMRHLIPRKKPAQVETNEEHDDHRQSHEVELPRPASVQTKRSSKRSNLVSRLTNGSFGRGGNGGVGIGGGKGSSSQRRTASASNLRLHRPSQSITSVVEAQQLDQVQRDLARAQMPLLERVPPVPPLPPLSTITPFIQEDQPPSFRPLSRIRARPQTVYSEKEPLDSPTPTRRLNAADLTKPAKRGRRDSLFQAFGFSSKSSRQQQQQQQAEMM